MDPDKAFPATGAIMESDEELDPPSYVSYLAARVAFDEGDVRRCIALLDASLGQGVHYKALELYGECLTRLGKVVEATGFHRRAFDANPKSDKTACLLAKAMLASGEKKSDIVEILLSVLSRNQTYGPARRLLAEIVRDVDT